MAQLSELATKARERIPRLVAEIERLVIQADPIELLSHLTLLHQAHRTDEQPDRDTAASWQVRIEWLSWLVFSRGLVAPSQPVLIDRGLLDPLEHLLQNYVSAVTMARMGRVDGLTEAQDEIRSFIQLNAICVRGEAYRSQLIEMALSLFVPHDDWCFANLGFTVRDAFATVEAIDSRFSDELTALRKAQHEISSNVEATPGYALTLDGLPPILQKSHTPGTSAADFAASVSGAWFVSRSPMVLGFTREELLARIDSIIPPDRVLAFLEFASVDGASIQGEPDLLSLPPLAKSPLIRHGQRHYPFVPQLMVPGICYALHSKLFADLAYRPTYDAARATWLEREAIAAFRTILPEADAGWGLTYGPRKERLEIDGLVRHDNKLILVECKWKRPTLSSLGGDVENLLKDIDGAVIQPLEQARRARAWIDDHSPAEFIESRTGRCFSINRGDINEVYLVTLVGSDAWALVAANLARFTPLGMFADGEFPWAVSLNDLRVIVELLEFPAQLFDYLRHRHEAQRDPRFLFHDEWDLLGVYLSGMLDVEDPRWGEMDGVVLDGFDSDIQDYFHARSNPDVTAPKPRRQLPKRIRELLLAVERTKVARKTDAICAVLGWPNAGLEALESGLGQVRQKAVMDGKAHAVVIAHPWRATQVALACGHSRRGAITEVLRNACEAQLKKPPTQVVGFGIDLAEPWNPIVMYFDNSGPDRPAVFSRSRSPNIS